MEEDSLKEKRKQLNFNAEAYNPLEKNITINQNPGNDSGSVLVNLLMGMNLNYTYKHDFLRLKDYTNISKLRETFSSLRNVNPYTLDMSQYTKADFFIIQAINYDDIHKAIKYGIWASDSENNNRISETYKSNLKEGRKVVLFFRAVSENVICGVAELTSDYLDGQQFNFWWSKPASKGVFNVKWLYVKNLDLSSVLRLENHKKLYELADGSNLSPENGSFLLELFRELGFSYEFSIFKYFELFDQREDYLLGVRTSMDVKITLQKQERKGSYHDSGAIKLRKGSHFDNVQQQSDDKKRDSVSHKKSHKEHHNKEERKSSHHKYKGNSENCEYVKKETPKIDQAENNK